VRSRLFAGLFQSNEDNGHGETFGQEVILNMYLLSFSGTNERFSLSEKDSGFKTIKKRILNNITIHVFLLQYPVTPKPFGIGYICIY